MQIATSKKCKEQNASQIVEHLLGNRLPTIFETAEKFERSQRCYFDCYSLIHLPATTKTLGLLVTELINFTLENYVSNYCVLSDFHRQELSEI